MENILKNPQIRTKLESLLGLKSQGTEGDKIYFPVTSSGDYSFIEDPEGLSKEIFHVLKQKHRGMCDFKLEVEEEGLTLHGYFKPDCNKKVEALYDSFLGVLFYYFHSSKNNQLVNN